LKFPQPSAEGLGRKQRHPCTLRRARVFLGSLLQCLPSFHLFRSGWAVLSHCSPYWFSARRALKFVATSHNVCLRTRSIAIHTPTNSDTTQHHDTFRSPAPVRTAVKVWFLSAGSSIYIMLFTLVATQHISVCNFRRPCTTQTVRRDLTATWIVVPCHALRDACMPLVAPSVLHFK
jgi:hypothetical protein